MVSSDDESDTQPESVSNYSFLDHDDAPISFATVPCLWSESDRVNRDTEAIYLHGTVDNGLRTLYKEVHAWRFDLSNVNPELVVLSKNNNWFKLQKPRKSYEDTVRSVLITMHCLHYLKRNPDASAKSLWDHLAKVFRSYEVKPSLKDLAEHTSLVSEALKRDDGLAKCKFLTTFLKEKPSMRKFSSEDVRDVAKPSFIVDDNDDMVEDIEDDPDAEEDEEEVFDSVCTICDNGGDLLCCEGRCMRSFHAMPEAGEDSLCDSLGYSETEVEAMQNFICKNCERKQHQCFVCGKLGSSDKFSGAEVFSCVSATCGRFYHPLCVSKLLHSKDEAAAEELQKDIAEGKAFTCPIHKCCICNQGENKKVVELQFAVCRRCPKSYHRKCLPKGIKFEDSEEEDGITRAWEGLLPNRILIYCLKHEIDEELGTPARNHIKFPEVEQKKIPAVDRTKKPAAVLSSSRELLKKTSRAPDVASGRISLKVSGEKRKLTSGAKESEKTKKIRASSEKARPRKVKATDASAQSWKDNSKSRPSEEKPGKTAKSSPNDVAYSVQTEVPEQIQPGKQDKIPGSKQVPHKLSSALPLLDANAERRILDILKDATASVSMQDVLEKNKALSIHSQVLKSYVEKTITKGKVEGAVEAAREALQKLDGGRSIEDAQAVCEPDVLRQIYKWKDKLKVYLAPFIFGGRYTSYGRHFTKVEKLQEIVDRLHCYVQKGDTIVDFCCGANDFSCLMEKKMEETGKKCLYRNYDLFPAKNNFHFERRDWLTVSQGELPPGNKLIMGLSPPFGVKAGLANKFIEKALEFKPKLLILVVPPETERLDKKKKFSYDLVWEDAHFLSGKSFYLPGSVGENDKQMEQWNISAPVIYLWSRSDWTKRHKDIARKQGHLGKNDDQNQFSVHRANNDAAPERGDGPRDIKEQEVVTESLKASSSLVNKGKESQKIAKKKKSGKPKPSVDDDPPRETRQPSPRLPVGILPFNGHSSKSPDYASNIDGILEDINQRYTNSNFEERYPGNNLIENYVPEADERYMWEQDIRKQISLYRREEPNPSQRVRSMSHEQIYGPIRSIPPAYGHLTSVPDPSYHMDTTAMQIYTPHLNELSQPRVSPLVPNPMLMGRSAYYEQRAPQPGYHGNPQGFAPGPYKPFFQSSSSGWLNE